MNCDDFTSSNGNGNAKGNYGAANRGARMEHHHDSLIFFGRFSEAAKTWRSERRVRYRTRAIFLRIRANPGEGTVVGTRLREPKWLSHSVLSSHRLSQRL